MAVLVTGGGVSLDNQTNYTLLAFDPGRTPRSKVWLRPKIRGAMPILAGWWDEEAEVTISLAVKGSSMADLLTKMNVVRDEFLTVTNTLLWTPPGGTLRTYTTYPSEIASVSLSNISATRDMSVAYSQYTVQNWTFTVTREPYAAEEASTYKTPVLG